MALLKSKDIEEEPMNEINITPLTDVLLVLLIIFMVAQTAITTTSRRINLPQVITEEEALRSEIMISITANGDMYVGISKVTKEQTHIVNHLKNLAKERQLRYRRVIIKADRESNYQDVVLAMESAKEADLGEIALAVQSRKPPE